MQIDHVEVFVSDREAALGWYGEWLGFTPIEAYRDWAETGPLMITNDGGASMLALFEGPGQDRDEDPRGWRRVAFRTDAADWLHFLERYRRSGQELDGPRDHARSWSVYFRDPWGNRLEVTTYDHGEIAAALERIRRS